MVENKWCYWEKEWWKTNGVIGKRNGGKQMVLLGKGMVENKWCYWEKECEKCEEYKEFVLWDNGLRLKLLCSMG